ncbi:hypothetical protein [Prevotella sp. oral taxon 376]|uniref:hypothetical protein n=1 Tax=Prevotella sp. oral taxon 376 TaxID=712466 RepID=UPI0011B1E5C7|nr:hypothetical protein [Prevotella sp. oral taxon 376]
MDFDGSRAYEMFAALANVRNNGSIKAFEPKGLPDDISYKTKEDYELWRYDAHSHSWVTQDELETAIKEARKPLGSYINEDYDALLAYMRAFRKEEVRFVFWFDN